MISTSSAGGIGAGVTTRPIAATAHAAAAAGTTRRGRSGKACIARSVRTGIARRTAAETRDSVGFRMPRARTIQLGAMNTAGALKNSATSKLSRVGRRIARTTTATNTTKKETYVRIWT